jgi:UDP-N-acetylmuramoyl-tripeptide--D-alanyl-D-alanine ligase
MKRLKFLIEGYILSKAATILARSESIVVAVVGSVGKTSTKDAVALALSPFGTVRCSPKSYNSNIGVALTILGQESPWSNPLAWLWLVVKVSFQSLYAKCPERYVVLEVGADVPGEIARVIQHVQVDVVVCTAWGDAPVHMEAFGDAEAVVRDDLSMIGALTKSGAVIINKDDKWFDTAVMLAAKHGASIDTYGTNIDANVRIDSSTVEYDGVRPLGMRFDMKVAGTQHSISVNGSVGAHVGYPLAAALATASVLGLNVAIAAGALAHHVSPKGRMKVLPGINGCVLIDDTYNSSPIAAEAALRMLATVEGEGMGIAVLGDMRELGSQAVPQHQRIGRLCAELGVDRIFAIGEHAKTLTDAAVAAGMSPSAVSTFHFVEEAAEKLKELPKAGDVVLLKGSQGIRVERATYALLENPEAAYEFLVRQDPAWRHR